MPDEVIIVAGTEENSVVLVTSSQGAPGTPGSTVAGEDASFVFTQGSPSASWVITHNLNKHPSITVVDSADTRFDGEEIYNNANQVTINFGAPFSGKAYLN